MLMANLKRCGKAGDEAIVPNAYSAGGGVVLGVGVENVANVARAELDQSGHRPLRAARKSLRGHRQHGSCRSFRWSLAA